MPSGRPKGSKNKVKQECAIINQDLVLTTTVYGTPIAIVSIGQCKSTYSFMVIPNYETKNFTTSISSLDVVKPVIDNPEMAKEFESIPFGTRIAKRSSLKKETNLAEEKKNETVSA